MDLDAFILIGGKSSRLGMDKAFVELGGQALADRSADVVNRALLPARIAFVAAGENQFNDDALAMLGHPVIFDLKRAFGAWSGIHTALAHAEREWTFILACDLPFISVELLRLLVGSATGDIEAAVLRQPDGRLQPLCAFSRTQPALAIVKQIFTAEQPLPPLNTIFDRLKTRVLEPDEYSHFSNPDKLFLNINTDVDLATALRHLI